MKRVQIEVTNLCNARCIFCPRDKIQYYGTMTAEVFGSLCYEIERIHPDVEEIVFSGHGEPFRNDGFIDKVSSTRTQFPKARLVIYSNGSLITQGHYGALESIGNVHLNVSLGGPYQKTRKALTGLDDWYRVVGSLEKCRIDWGVSMVAHPVISQVTLQRFIDMFGEKATIVQFQSWAGLMYRYNGPTPGRCNRRDGWATYNWQAKNIKCCYDIGWGADCSQCTEAINI